jgi:uncharacterized protein (DUF1684 family)
VCSAIRPGCTSARERLQQAKYNPYCAYNEHWSCPLTPFENRLKVAIRAGEKIFQH